MRLLDRLTATGCVAGLALMVAALAQPVEAQVRHKPRVASTSLCSDQFVLLFADTDQIATVSYEATGPLSIHPERVGNIPINRGEIESVIATNAEIVVLDGSSDAQLIKGLGQLKIPTVTLGMGPGFDDVKVEIRKIAAALDQKARGEAYIADMDRRIAALKAIQPPEDRRPIMAYYRPDGGGAAANTFVDTAVALGGFRNIQTLHGQTGWAGFDLEHAALTPPQAFLVSYFDNRGNSLSGTLGYNPILRRTKAPVINIPGKLWACTSATLIDAAEEIARQRLLHFPESGKATGRAP